LAEQDLGPNLVRIHSDSPATQAVRFGFDSYADTLAGLIANPKNETPLVIGIYGQWGSGKTTLMQAIRERLDGKQANELIESLGASPEDIRRCKTVWFQAWKYDKESEILAGLLETVFQTMAKGDFFSRAKAKIEKLAEGLDKQKILGFVTKLVTGVDVSDFFKEMEYKKHLGFYDTFRSFFGDLILTYLNWRFKLSRAEQPDDSRGALVIFIDDLDRCPKPRIVKVLETIKLFMDYKGCVFVIGADQDIIVDALANEYKKEEAYRFMEKIVQVTFNLPRVTKESFETYLDGFEGAPAEIKKNLHLIMPAMGNNPRQLKRFVNNLNLRHGLMRSSELSIEFDSVLHWGIIEHAFPLLAADIKDNPSNFFAIKRHINAIADKMEHRKVWEADEDLLKNLNVPQSLHKYILNESIVNVLNSFKIKKEAFIELVTLSSSVKSDKPISQDSENQIMISRRTETMVEVPIGSFKFGKSLDQANIDTAYWIDIYLVTNAQYRVFIEHSGYETEEWWPEKGWTWREKELILRPKFWEDPKWNQDDHPVVGVSWYEATAFCNWLSSFNKDGFRFHLPSERQWERAARGNKDGLVYPWGNEFDPDCCNAKDAGIGKTTRVDRYANGVSPVGCYDMAGNVWEWTSDLYDPKKGSYTLKGGSWYSPGDLARCDYSFSYFPHNRVNFAGFRCARTRK
jgi:formylglycine-generating enzyme required for sulfatase activity